MALRRYAWQTFAQGWTGGLYGELPPLEKVLTAIVHDCCPADLTDAQNGAAMSEDIQSVYTIGIVTVVEAFLQVPCGLGPGMRDNKDKDRRMGELSRSQMPVTQMLSSTGVDNEDFSSKFVVPRLFLYSGADKLILSGLVEEYVDGLRNEWRKNKIQERLIHKSISLVKSEYAPHMMMGTYEPDLFADAIHTFVASHTGDHNSEHAVPANWKKVKGSFVEFALSSVPTE